VHGALKRLVNEANRLASWFALRSHFLRLLQFDIRGLSYGILAASSKNIGFGLSLILFLLESIRQLFNTLKLQTDLLLQGLLFLRHFRDPVVELLLDTLKPAHERLDYQLVAALCCCQLVV